MELDYQKIKEAAEGYKKEMSAFLRAMISHPSESCEEKDVVMCIKEEMEKVGFDKVEIDGLGNVIGWAGKNGDIGDDKKIIAIDGHIDTVGIDQTGLQETLQHSQIKGKAFDFCLLFITCLSCQIFQ